MKLLSKLRYLMLVTGLLLGVQFGLLQLQAQGAAADAASSLEQAEQQPGGYPDGPDLPITEADLLNPDMPPLAEGSPVIGPLNPIDKAAQARTVQRLAQRNAGAPFTIWYGDNQTFGAVGHPTPHINILGSIGAMSGVSLSYSLNGGAEQPLSLGPDERRLWNEGDFNVEISRTLLASGGNQVVLFARNNISSTLITHTVNLNYISGTTWPLPYTADWSTTSDVNALAQVVDGFWQINGSTLDVVQSGYDRLVAIGDQGWTDYEVTAPVFVRGVSPAGGPSNGAGIGFIARWPGHFQTAPGEQPLLGWRRLGALAWHRWGTDNTAGLEMRGFGGVVLGTQPNKQLQLNTQYILKMSVQSVPGKPSYYRFKLWPAAQAEPGVWDIESAGRNGEPATGSLLLMAHNVDASFGTITVRPLSQIISTLNVTTDGNGTVVASPTSPTYTYGQKVTLTPLGNLGFKFNNWTGDISSTANPLIFNVTKNTSVRANFVPGPNVTLDVNAVGPGSVVVSPTKSSYQYNEVVELIAQPQAGFMLQQWSGDLKGSTTPTSLTLSGNKVVTATFGELLAPKSDDFNRCVLTAADKLWSFEDPVGDGSFEINGEQLILNVPENSDHNVWSAGNKSVRVMAPIADQTAGNLQANFELEVKFDSVLTKTTGDRFQIEGILIEQDANNYLRFDFFNTNTEVRVFAGRIKDGVPFELLDAPITPVPDSAMYMRVKRSGNSNTWTQSYSFDGVNWTEVGSFNYAITVAKAGIFAGNSGKNPAFTSTVDYFMNRATPITPEDGKAATLTTATTGQGAVAVAPNKSTYSCGEEVTLTATPANGWNFAGWSGGASGTTNPLVVSYDRGLSITATFTETGAPEEQSVYLPLILR